MRTIAQYLIGSGRELLAGARGVPAQKQTCDEVRWSTFAAVLDRDRELLAAEDREGGSLPVFDLAAALFETTPAGSLAVRLALTAPERTVRRKAWWRALLRGVDRCRRVGDRTSVEDRPEVARALLCRVRHLLSNEARNACLNALGDGVPTEEPVSVRPAPEAHAVPEAFRGVRSRSLTLGGRP